jgi:hypothetical protein
MKWDCDARRRCRSSILTISTSSRRQVRRCLPCIRPGINWVRQPHALCWTGYPEIRVQRSIGWLQTELKVRKSVAALSGAVIGTEQAPRKRAKNPPKDDLKPVERLVLDALHRRDPRENVEWTLFLPNKGLRACVAAGQASEAGYLVLERIVPFRRLARMRVARCPLT